MFLDTDVLVLILACVNYSDLPSLCRVDSTFYELASDRLYHHICYPDVLRVCYTLLFRPALAAKVRHFKIPHCTSESQRCWSTLSAVGKALRAMTGLQSLHVADSGVPSWVLRHCPFRVITFSFAAQCDADLVEFLERQEQIQDLVLGPHSPNLVLKPTALPKLTKVKARTSWLSILVPGRPVRDVIFNDTSHCAEIDIKFLSHSIAPIQRLSIVAENVYTLPISQFVAIVPHLHVLIISCPFIGSRDTWVSLFIFSLATFDGDICSSEQLGPSHSGWLPWFRFFWNFATSL